MKSWTLRFLAIYSTIQRLQTDRGEHFQVYDLRILLYLFTGAKDARSYPVGGFVASIPGSIALRAALIFGTS